MQNLLTKYSNKDTQNTKINLWEYFSLELSLEEQIQKIEEKAKELGETDAFAIALQQHLLAVLAMLDAQAMVSNDDYREYLNEPAEWLERTSRQVFALSQSEFQDLKSAINYTKNMRYSDLSFFYLKEKYDLAQEESNLFENIEISPKEISQRLQEDLEDAKEIPIMTEKAKSEVIVYPILREIKKSNPNINFFSGYTLNVQAKELLTGKPDFMISAKPHKSQLKAPIFCLLEAKNGMVEEGYAQCAGEMYAARLFNQENGEPYQTIYGAVTNAYEWVFLKLEKDTIWIDTERYFLNEVTKILGILQFIIEEAKRSTK